MFRLRRPFFIAVVFLFAACGNSEQPVEAPVTEEPVKANIPQIEVPVINGDSAYAYVAAQVAFGPRVPGTKAHEQCAAWLEAKLKSYIPETIVQRGVATTYDQRKFELKNIIASYKPELGKRILLSAHWDTRPFADRDEGKNKNKPLDGANDGASGVGVLIEIARQLSLSNPEIGVDIILFDLEDYGQPEDSKFPDMEHSWCLGAQYWAQNMHKPGYYAKFGILLDMVGARDAVFPKEGVSKYFAPQVVDKIWSTAANLGYGDRFINAEAGSITDDHVYINQLANIPTAVIIHYDSINRDFFGHHHRISDNMDNIDATVLGLVGQTVLQVVFNESVTKS